VETKPPTQRDSRTGKLLRRTGGALLILLGAVLTVLPGPGLVLVFAGLELLAVDHPGAARLRERLLREAGTTGRRIGRTLAKVVGIAGIAAIAIVVLLAGLIALAVTALT
jgi:hypothetical protein